MKHDDDYFDYLAAAMTASDDQKRSPPNDGNGCGGLIGLVLFLISAYIILVRWLH